MLDQKLYGPKHFLMTQTFLLTNILLTNIFFDPSFFGTEIIFDSKYFVWPKNVGPLNILDPKKGQQYFV